MEKIDSETLATDMMNPTTTRGLLKTDAIEVEGDAEVPEFGEA